jgi:hypothetical protein
VERASKRKTIDGSKRLVGRNRIEDEVEGAVRDDCRMNGEIQGEKNEIRESRVCVQDGSVHSDGDNGNIPEFHGSRKKDVDQAGDKQRGKKSSKIKSTYHRSRCQCCRISSIEPLIHRPASNGHQKVHNLKQHLSRQNAA